MVTSSYRLTAQQRRILHAHNIDSELSQAMLERLNSRSLEEAPGAKRLPPPDHPQLVDIRGEVTFSLPSAQLRHRLEHLLPQTVVESYWKQLSPQTATLTLNNDALCRLGYLLYPQLAFGILNGGSALNLPK